MLRSIKVIRDYVLFAKDGEIGRCKDFLFDDEKWTVRYMVADTRKWLPGRKVLISPASLGMPDWLKKRFPVNLTREQIENCPHLDADAPVSRQYEKKYAEYYHWPYYWTGGEAWITTPSPPGKLGLPEGKVEESDEALEHSHLRSVQEVIGYHIRADDGEIGHVEDFIVDDASWRIRYMVVDTRNWLPGRQVLVTPQWIASVDWKERSVAVNLTTGQVKASPEFDPSEPVNREYETRLYDYYGRPAYWTMDDQ